MPHNPLLEFQKQQLEAQKQQAEFGKQKLNLQLQGAEISPQRAILQNMPPLATRRQSKGQALLDGLMSGLKAGMSAEEAKKKQKVLETAGQWFESLEAHAQELSRLNQENAHKEQMKQDIFTPAALAFQKFKMGNLETGQGPSYQEITEAAKTQFDKLKASKLIQGDFIGVDYNNDDLLMYRDPQGNIQHFDVASLIPQETLKLMPELSSFGRLKAQMGVRQANLDAQSSQANIRHTEAQIEEMPQKLQVRRQEASTAERNADHKNFKLVHDTIGEELDATTKFLHHAPRMMEIVNRNPGIFQSLRQIQWTNDEPGYLSNFIRNLDQKSPDAADIATMAKYINQLKIDVANGFARPNQFLEKTAAGAVPNFNMPPQAIEKVLQEMISDAQYRETILRKRLKVVDTTHNQRFSEAYTDEDLAITPPPQATVQQHALQEQSAEPQEPMVMMVDEDTGQEEAVPAYQVEAAQKLGLKVKK